MTISEKCKKWLSKPEYNPDTNRKIKTSGKIYKQLEKDCLPIKLSPISERLSKLKQIL